MISFTRIIDIPREPQDKKMLTPSEAPSFKNLFKARWWAFNASLAEPFYLVKIDYYHDFTMYEFYSYAEIKHEGGLGMFNVVEVWQ